MNQAVIRIYLLILVGALALVLAVWPRRPRGPARGEGFLRFFATMTLGGALVLFGFHAPGQVRHLVVSGGAAWVLEVHPGRWWGERVWTRIRLADGTAERAGPPTEQPSIAVRTSTLALDLPRSLRGRLRRPSPSGPAPIGPVLEQPVLAFATPDWAVVAAYEEVSRPASVFVAGFDDRGALRWRQDAAALGLAAGRLRRSAPAGENRLLLVFSGARRNRGLLGTLAQDRHVVATLVSRDDGLVHWTVAF